MPRCRRSKSPESIYHVIIKSITEVILFKTDSDKELYLYLLRKYQQQYKFKIYAYCLMDNHGHLIIDSNGADISRIMHDINFSYAQNYNRNHRRRGTLFQDRFKSKIIKNDRYLITASAYIHNNPRAIENFKINPSDYKYSSLAYYLGIKRDESGLVDKNFVMNILGKRGSFARKNYKKLISLCDDIMVENEIEFLDEKMEYRNERHIIVRKMSTEEIIQFVTKIMDVNKDLIHIKNVRNMTETKALIALLMKSLCNFTCADICKILGNITESRVSKLCSIGVCLIENDGRYKNLIERFVTNFAITKVQ